MIVMKFGGTSIGDVSALRRVCSIVRERLQERPVVVVSALAGVTDKLTEIAKTASMGDKDGALRMSGEMRTHHQEIAAAVAGDTLARLSSAIEKQFDELNDLLCGIAAVRELTPRSSDSVLGLGERVSSRIVAAMLASSGIKAIRVDYLRCIVTDSHFGKASPLQEQTSEQLNKQIIPLLAEEKVPVLAGYIAATEKGITTTLGRGGSDFSAAIVGAALQATRIEIWSDVDGLMTTDPKLCSDATRIKSISFEEAAELAHFGAKVLHPATLLPAIERNIPVVVLNSRNATNAGTRITAQAPQSCNIFKGIAVKRGVSTINIVAPRMLMAHGFLKSVFEVLDRHRCPVDVVSTSEVSISLTVDSKAVTPSMTAELAELAEIRHDKPRAIVCLVGENLRSNPSISAQLFGSIPDAKIRMISHGASDISINFVVDEQDVPGIVSQLHHRFFSELDPNVFEARC